MILLRPFDPAYGAQARARLAGFPENFFSRIIMRTRMPAGPAVSAASGSAALPPAAAAPTALAPQDRDPLYREFLEWRASRAKASTNR